MQSVLIIGVGQFGWHIAKKMNELDCEVMAIDINEERINEVLPYVVNAQIGDSTNQEFMKSLGVRNYDICIVTIGENFQTSLETTSLLKELGAPMVISRATNDVQRKFLLRNGADEVVYPEKQMAIRVATKYSSDIILDFIQLDSNYSIYELRIPKEWAGKTLAQLDIRKKYNVNIIAIKRADGVNAASADSKFDKEDLVLAIGKIGELKKCFKI